MLEKIKSNQILLTTLGIFVLIILVVGITYAGFSKTSSGGNNSISSGTISMSFQEPSNNVVITNAMPTSNGYSSATHFDFSVSATAKSAITIPYEISITEKSGNTLDPCNVRIGLKKNGAIVSGFEVAFDPSSNNGTKATLLSNNMTQFFVGSKPNIRKRACDLESSSIRNGSKVLIHDSITLTQSGSNYTATDNYQLFLWLDESYEMPSDGSTESYSISVNVNSNIGAVGITPTEVYVVSGTTMHIGSTLPNGVNGRSTPELAMQDWLDITYDQETRPFYLRHVLNSFNEIEESYVEFVVTEDMANANSGMVAGTYSLRGGDSGASYATNVDTIKAAFGYSTNSSRCTDNGTNFSCSVSGLSADAYDSGYVSAYGTDRYNCSVDVGGSSSCDRGGVV